MISQEMASRSVILPDGTAAAALDSSSYSGDMSIAETPAGLPLFTLRKLGVQMSQAYEPSGPVTVGLGNNPTVATC